MLYELRTYRAMPGKLPFLLQRFETRTLKIFERIGIRQVGFWTTVIGHSHLQLVYLLAWESLEERERKWDAFSVDPEWLEVWKASESDGVLVENVDNQILRPTVFSGLR